MSSIPFLGREEGGWAHICAAVTAPKIIARTHRSPSFLPPRDLSSSTPNPSRAGPKEGRKGRAGCGGGGWRRGLERRRRRQVNKAGDLNLFFRVDEYLCPHCVRFLHLQGIVECGVTIDQKASPRRAAIEKAQEELRQEYDVREERRRELEFLEKGGNPLDFKLGHVESVSVQSTSVADHTTEQNVISEAKGSFACAASPHGDSVESSGKPGSSSCRDANTGDNLMLLDGDTSNTGGEKLVKRGTKRTNASQPDMSLCCDGQNNVKEAEDSGLFRLGAKNQAYARRRSKSSRENATVSLGSQPVSPLCSQGKDSKGIIQETKSEDHGASSISNSRPASPNGNNTLKDASLGDRDAMEKNNTNEGKQATTLETTSAKDGLQTLVISPNSVQLIGDDLVVTAANSVESPDTTPKEAALVATSSFPSLCNEVLKEACVAEKAGNGCSDKNLIVHADDIVSKSADAVPSPVVDIASLNVKEADITCANMSKTIDEHHGKSENISGKVSDEDLGDSIPCDNDGNKDGQLEGGDIPTVVDGIYNSVQPEVSSTIYTKDDIDAHNKIGDAQKDAGNLATSGHEEVDKEAGFNLKRNNRCSPDFNAADKLDSVAMASGLLTKDVPSSVSLMDLDNDVKKSGENIPPMEKKECRDSTVVNKEHEDSILRRAQLIEVNIKKAGECSLSNAILEKKQMSHWDFVLEEMAWMANEFMQMCHWIAFSGRATFEEANIKRKQKLIARILAKSIMNFWCSAETLRGTGGRISKEGQPEESIGLEETKLAGVNGEKEQCNESLEQEKPRCSSLQSPVQNYALRFLKDNCNISKCLSLAEAPATPDRLNDFGILKVPDHLSEEKLFYGVVPGAMQAYREFVGIQKTNKKTNNSRHNDDYEPSTTGSVAGSHRGNAYEDDDVEASTYLLPGSYDGGLASKSYKKKHMMQQRMNGTRHYGTSVDMPYDPYVESKSGNHPFLSNGKRPSDLFNIPTKRIRTAARQRVVSPYPANASGATAFTNKTDASSGDTNSCQDDQSSLHGGSFPRKNVDIESTADFDRQLYDSSEVSTKSKKKKKSKHPGYKTPQTVAESCSLIAGKKDYLKKRSEVHPFDSNGNIVTNGQHGIKKPKLMNQPPDVSLEALTPVGPMVSPAASQMSNMANPTKIIKIITNRDRGRKNKVLKMAAGHSGPGSPWSSFEDQALVVLVHDMGQNWELVSDALNSIVQRKCIYRRPHECKDRHKLLTERSSVDGADSADDSGSSQHYQSTLPGIPKGSARQLFQRLQGPFEEETLKAHFEKIIFLGQKLHPNRKKGENQELMQINPLHSSHVQALSQACAPGVVLMPLDLCDAMTPNPDALSIGYSGSHASGLLSNHPSSVGPTLPTANLNTRVPGSPCMVLGNTLPSPSTPNAPRDTQRYGIPRPTSLQGDEQQRIQYSQMLNSRSLQQPVPGALPAGVDRGVRMMSGAHGMGMMTGINRGTVTRPPFPRLSSSGMLNMVSPGSMLPNNGQSMQNTVNVHPGTIPGHGNTMLRPRDPMQMLWPGQNMEEHRQMMMQEFQMQVSQGNSQSIHYTGTPFSNVGASSPGHPFPVQSSQPHQMPQQSHVLGNTHHPHIQGTTQSSPQQQAYGMRLAKDRHAQQCVMTQQQHPLSGASTASPVQNGSQMQQQSQGPPSSVQSSQSQHKQQHPTQNSQDNSVLPSQPVNTSHKQKKQQGQQQSRQNQQQRNQGSQQAKLMKSLGRGNMMHHSPPVETTQASGIPTTPKNQVSDKTMVQQGPGYFTGNKGLVSSVVQPGNQHKLYGSQMLHSPIQTPDVGNQSSMQSSPNQTLLTSQQAPLHSSSPLATQQQQQQQRYMNPSHNNIQRLMMQQNRHMNTDGRIESPVDQVQHNQIIPSTSMAKSADSGSPGGVSSINQRRQESSHDPTAVLSTLQLASSPQDTYVGNEMLLSASSQGMLQRQMSGGVPIHGHGIGGQRQQQQSQQQKPSVQGSRNSLWNVGNPKLTYTENVKLLTGSNIISCLSLATGFPNVRTHFETWNAGILGLVTLDGLNEADIQNGPIIRLD
uniref:Myb-like domain-containing protein n=1 Tax=Leersia perrieri TaxID=77586 RepID=A0A0D9XV79_9ORYZ